MSSDPANDDPTPEPTETGKIRRWPVRRIAVCAGAALLTLAAAAGGWMLHGALRPAADPTDAPLLAEAGKHDHAERDKQPQSPHTQPPADASHESSSHAEHDARNSDLTGDDYAELLEGRLPNSLHGDPLEPVDHATNPPGDHDEPSPDAPTPSAAELDRAASLAEGYMFAGEPQRALQLFDWLLEYQDRSRDDRFHYRCGLCAEATGKLNRALREYGTALGAADDPTIIALCRLGQARVWKGLGNTELATQILAAAWLTNGREGHAAVVRSFNAYLLASAIASEILDAHSSELSEDGACLFPAWEFDIFERTLLTSTRYAPSGEDSIKGGVRLILDSENEDAGAEIFLQINLPRTSLVNTVEALCRTAGWRVTWSEAAREAAAGRSAEICQARAGLEMCLDVLTTPLKIVWTRQGQEIRLSAIDEVAAETIKQTRHDAARRALQHAVRQHPDSLLAPEALIALGNIALREGRTEDAVELYERVLEDYSTDPVRAAAWFNLAKLHLKVGRTHAALDAFWHVVDSGGPPDVASVAYLYVGRLLIDAEEPRRAVSPLIRATKWAPGPKIRAKSVLCLAAAYLLYGNPKGANEVLMDFRTDVKSQAMEAAFLSALARYRVADSPPRRFIEGQALLAAVDSIKPQDFFGHYGWYLCGHAYQELLLSELAAETFQQAIDKLERPPYHDPLHFSLAECRSAMGDVDAARRRLTYMLEHSAPDWQRRAAFMLCRLQLDSDLPQAAAHTAHELVAQCTDRFDKARALHLLGESYQQLGDHRAAALCFAGSVPDHPPPTETVNP